MKKTLALLFALAVSAQAITYKMRDIPKDSPKFAKILAEMNRHIRQQNASPPLPGGWTFKILQTVGPGKYIAVREVGAERETCALEMPGTVMVDDSRVQVPVEENGIYSYPSVTGANKTVRCYKRIVQEQKAQTPEMTADDLIAKLKSGKSCSFYAPKLTRCQVCSGTGKGTEKNGKCPLCAGKGELNMPIFCRVEW